MSLSRCALSRTTCVGELVARDGARDLDAAQARHLDVEHGDVRSRVADRSERGAPVLGLGHELELGSRAHGARDGLPVQRVVVGHEDRDAVWLAAGHLLASVGRPPKATARLGS